jgi:hypothetical protein
MFWSLRIGRENPYLKKNGNGHQAAVDTCADDGGQPAALVERRPQSHGVLVPMMLGSQMVLMPRSEHGVVADWPRSIPTKE